MLSSQQGLILARSLFIAAQFVLWLYVWSGWRWLATRSSKRTGAKGERDSSPVQKASRLKRDRNHPAVIKERMLSVVAASAVAWYLCQGSGEQLPIQTIDLSSLLSWWCWCVGHTLVLFCGPLFVEGCLAVAGQGLVSWALVSPFRVLVSLGQRLSSFSPLFWLRDTSQSHPDVLMFWQGFRNYFIGPIVEEMVFRYAVFRVLSAGSFSDSFAVGWSALLFGLAHCHHGLVELAHHVPSSFYFFIFRNGRHDPSSSLSSPSNSPSALSILLGMFFQLAYTFLFGVYAGWIYLYTGHRLSCAVLVHAVCNIMGVPDIERLDDLAAEWGEEWRGLGWAMYGMGLVGFIWRCVVIFGG